MEEMEENIWRRQKNRQIWNKEERKKGRNGQRKRRNFKLSEWKGKNVILNLNSIRYDFVFVIFKQFMLHSNIILHACPLLHRQRNRVLFLVFTRFNSEKENQRLRRRFPRNVFSSHYSEGGQSGEIKMNIVFV